MIEFKKGVLLHGLVNEVWLALIVAEAIYEEHGLTLVVTSARDGTHSRASAHYTGRAVDLRIRNVAGYGVHGSNSPEIQEIAADLRAALGQYYDVVLESDHIHVEFDPKVNLSKDWLDQPTILEWVS